MGSAAPVNMASPLRRNFGAYWNYAIVPVAPFSPIAFSICKPETDSKTTLESSASPHLQRTISHLRACLRVAADGPA
jgi:hypothetical protein